MKPIFLIDTDTASDDAVALIMALRSPEIEVKAITVVSGNVDVDQGTRNALYVTELCGRQVPVHRGAERPLLRRPVYAHFFHGRDGMGDRGYSPTQQSPHDQHAVSAIIATARTYPGLTVVTLGPLTNLALALRQAPDIVSKVGRCVVMGGAACTEGNVTPAAEYNMWVDPEAARLVFSSGLPIEMVGWELCRGEANLSFDEIDRLRGRNTSWARFAVDCNATAIEANAKQSGDRGMALPDPVAMAVALKPELCLKRGLHYVQVETVSPLTRGMTVVDRLGVSQDERNQAQWGHLPEAGRISVCWELDIPGWKRLLFELLT